MSKPLTLDQFINGDLTEDVMDAVNAVRRRFAFGVFSRLISPPPQGTPRDTNRANNGWDLTAVSPGGADPGPSKKRHTPKRAQESRGEVVRAGVKDPIYITNNVPYIVALNNGHSQQSPTGFVEAAVESEERKAGFVPSDFV